MAFEVGEREAAVDLQLVVDYSVSTVDLARSVRRNVICAIEQMTGLKVVEIIILTSPQPPPATRNSPNETPS